MKMSTAAIALVLGIVVFPLSAHAIYMDSVDVFEVGTSVTITWEHFYDGSESPEALATLEIVAEGVDAPGPDGGENDSVFFNGNFLGELTQQDFYNSGFEINPGPGALGDPLTELTTSIFNFDPSWLIVGLNTIEVVIDPTNWIMEVETSKLTVESVSVPAPTVLTLLSLGVFLTIPGLRRNMMPR